ncbi:uncharacterized protein LOC132754565 [Ruditapes philippinarum]|uniref:uncharacterized protein LOC132754565 n=1 Tax=Ruditapes philippinarum TaxID=129788 RepID=UPI00295BF187|nr:uncharacterized protein LOC132754565 [Ruditapes philippinarum]
MPAMTIFAMSIRYLRNHLLKRLEKEEPWAGISSSRLTLALEPESASVWYTNATDKTRTLLSKAWTQYMVIDLGVYAEAEKGNRSTDEIIASLGRSQKTKFEGNKFHVNSSVIKEFFDPTVTHLISNVEAIVAEPRMKNVKTILLAGVFSESEIIYDAFKKQLKKTHNIIRPSEASLAVLKDAVMFGHMPNTIKSKIMSFTYGVAALENPDYSTNSASKWLLETREKLSTTS